MTAGSRAQLPTLLELGRDYLFLMVSTWETAERT